MECETLTPIPHSLIIVSLKFSIHRLLSPMFEQVYNFGKSSSEQQRMREEEWELGSEKSEGNLAKCLSILKTDKWEIGEYGMVTSAKIWIWEKVTLDRAYVEDSQRRPCVWKEVSTAVISWEWLLRLTENNGFLLLTLETELKQRPFACFSPPGESCTGKEVALLEVTLNNLD